MASKVTGVEAGDEVVVVVLVLVVVTAEEVEGRDVEVVPEVIPADGVADSCWRGQTAKTNAPRIATSAAAASSHGHRDGAAYSSDSSAPSDVKPPGRWAVCCSRGSAGAATGSNISGGAATHTGTRKHTRGARVHAVRTRRTLQAGTVQSLRRYHTVHTQQRLGIAER